MLARTALLTLLSLSLALAALVAFLPTPDPGAEPMPAADAPASEDL